MLTQCLDLYWWSICQFSKHFHITAFEPQWSYIAVKTSTVIVFLLLRGNLRMTGCETRLWLWDINWWGLAQAFGEQILWSFFPRLLGPKFFLNIYSFLNQNQVSEVSGGLGGISGPLISPFCKMNDCWGKGTIFGALPKLLFQ